MLFTYGTLSFPEVFERVVGRRLPSRPARLDGFGCFLFADAVYPGAIPRPGMSTAGRLYAAIPAAAWCRLDAFEGARYRRERHSVHLIGGPNAATIPAHVYVVTEPARNLLAPRAWDPDGFRREGLPRLLQGDDVFGEA